MKAWLGVASHDHVRRGVEGGFAQVCHGKRTPLARLRPGDALVYYSPTEKRGIADGLMSFTAVGVVEDELLTRVDMGGGFLPWRRKVRFFPATPVPVAEIAGSLLLTAGPNWGYALRRGLLELAPEDLETIRKAMDSSDVLPDVPRRPDSQLSLFPA